MTLNSALKSTIPVTVPDFISQASQYFYLIPAQTVYRTALNLTKAAILQAYSQFNVQPTAIPSIVNHQLNTQQQQMREKRIFL